MGNTTDVKKEDLKPETVAVAEAVSVSGGSEVKATLGVEVKAVAVDPAIKSVAVGEGPITFEQFQAVDIRVGEVKGVEPVPKSDKMLKLTVDFGALGTRTVMAGIGKSFGRPGTPLLVERRFGFVVNLAPRPIMGVESQAMLLAATDAADGVVLMECPGAKVGARLG